MATLPISGLRAFEAASRSGSFRAAAAELNLSPSAVSHAIHRLERRLGVTLFEREGRTLLPSAAGETLMRHTAQGFAELRRGLADVATGGRRELRLHCAPSFAAQWLVPRLSRLLSLHPSLEVNLHADANYSRFTSDDYDADLIYGLPRTGGLDVLPLGEERVVPLCAPGLAATLAGPSDLVAHVLIQSDSKTVRWSDWFAANGVAAPPMRGPRFDRSFLALAAAADGLGIALESTLLAERELADGRLVEPLRSRSVDCRYVGHRLLHRPSGQPYGPLATFKGWLASELGLA